MKLKKTTIAIVSAVLLLTACNKNNKENTDVAPAKPINPHNVATLEPPFICIDSANKMLNSYINSVGSNDLKSIIIDAGALRTYLANSSITNIKIMFAHRLDYINSGGANQSAGYNYAKLTLVLAGLDANNDYVYNTDNGVLDNGVPCPTNCPVSGTAASNTLQ